MIKSLFDMLLHFDNSYVRRKGFATFIGTNGSLGLINGKSYKIDIRKQRYRNNGVVHMRYVVYWKDKNGDIRYCPYSSFQSLKNNWMYI